MIKETCSFPLFTEANWNHYRNELGTRKFSRGIAVKPFSIGINLESDCIDHIICNMSILLLHIQFKVILIGTFLL